MGALQKAFCSVPVKIRGKNSLYLLYIAAANSRVRGSQQMQRGAFIRLFRAWTAAQMVGDFYFLAFPALRSNPGKALQTLDFPNSRVLKSALRVDFFPPVGYGGGTNHDWRNSNMDQKKSFGAYIRKKRQDTGLTQKELASQLYVTESTVSKWERGMSYPDVSLIPDVCRALSITEHEFFIACDDDKAHEQARAAEVWQGVTRGWFIFFAAAYAVATLACFICNLAIYHTLDWFWIVLTSLMLAFSFTNLPLLVKKNRLPICLGSASGSLVLLLLSCWAYTGGAWVLGGMAITAVSLALPWGVWAIWRLYGLHVAPLSMALFSLWIFALLTVIWAFTGGDWLWTMSFPIAGFCLMFLWMGFACLYWLPLNGWLKAGLVWLLLTFAVPLGNCLSNWMTPSQKVPLLADYFAFDRILTHQDINGFSWINVLVFALMLLTAVLLLVAGAVLEIRRRRAAASPRPHAQG